ncbi:MAG: Wzz/FepE/Etk N-terminal domain-containing protein [Pseudomonas sp.]|nr:Wzz/FepE/Etk N-terminal domain-containing protein [Pseudomonas sp.]
MTEQTYQRQANNDDEIDLVELLQNLWAQRWLIVIVTSVVALSALVYAFTSKPVYSTTAVLSPAPINAFGLIANEVKVGPPEGITSAISIGINLAHDALAVVVKNFESAAIRNEFDDSLGNPLDYLVEVKRHRGPVPSNPELFESVSISVSSMSAAGAKQYLDGFMAYVSKVSAAQLNDYFKALNLNHTIQPGVLYRVEQSPAVNLDPIKPKKPLIVALGVVLGGMLGVFIALIRLMLRKRAAKAL